HLIVTGVQTCALPICGGPALSPLRTPHGAREPGGRGTPGRPVRLRGAAQGDGVPEALRARGARAEVSRAALGRAAAAGGDRAAVDRKSVGEGGGGRWE